MKQVFRTISERVDLYILLKQVAFYFSIAVFVSTQVANGQNSSMLFPVSKDGKSGFINSKGEIVIPLIFERTGYFSEGLGIVFQNNKCGYTNDIGHIVIGLRFDECRTFSEGLAAVRVDGGKGNQWGYIDRNGNYIVQPIYDDAYPFKEGLAVVAKYNDKKIKSRYKNREGKRSISFQYFEYGFIDKEGKLVIPMIYSSAQDFSEGLASVALDDGWGYINKKGETVIKPKYIYAGRFVGGLASVAKLSSTGEKYGFINKLEQVVIPLKYNDAGDFSEGLAPVKTGKMWGYINTSGQFLINPQFNNAWNFSEGIALTTNCTVECEFVYLDKSGNIITTFPFKTTGANGFKNGLAAIVTDNNGLCYINKDGEFVWKQIDRMDSAGKTTIKSRIKQ